MVTQGSKTSTETPLRVYTPRSRENPLGEADDIVGQTARAAAEMHHALSHAPQAEMADFLTTLREHFDRCAHYATALCNHRSEIGKKEQLGRADIGALLLDASEQQRERAVAPRILKLTEEHNRLYHREAHGMLESLKRMNEIAHAYVAEAKNLGIDCPQEVGAYIDGYKEMEKTLHAISQEQRGEGVARTSLVEKVRQRTRDTSGRAA